jgi:mono/diheme cytochrome c family protein
LADGKKLYNNFCSQCHGANGAGDGKIGQINVVLMPPAYNSDQLKDLPEGKIFHSITYGKGMMGAHQYQLTKLERWKLVHYVQSLQKQGQEATVVEKVEDDSSDDQTNT